MHLLQTAPQTSGQNIQQITRFLRSGNGVQTDHADYKKFNLLEWPDTSSLLNKRHYYED